MTITLGFDVYGTLIDTAGITTALQEYVGELAPAFSSLWRDKQLEYSFRRGLMQNYQNFGVCTKSALDFVCSFYTVDLSTSDKKKLMGSYSVLPPFPDVKKGLELLKDSGARMFAFSNGRAEDVAGLLKNAQIDSYFEGVVSTDEIKSFKPNPGVYSHFLRRAGAVGSEAWLISGNSFDVIGAISAGMRGAWVKRSEMAIFDPWEIEPTLIVKDIGELHQRIPLT